MDDQCRLCGDTEKNFHIFYCHDSELASKRKKLWDEAERKMCWYVTKEAMDTINIMDVHRTWSRRTWRICIN